MAPNTTPHDAEIEMAELEMEEHRILRELKEMDEKANESTLQKKRYTSRDEPKHALNSLLLDCENEVREAKGFISSTGPPLRIARCRRGEGVPAHATFLSRPKGTGVDFTVPVTLKEYSTVVERPIFLNGIRDKCSANKYNSPEEYIADMKLLAKNTAAFNKGPQLAWVVQHAKLLLECADDAVRRRKTQFNEIMSNLGGSGGGERRVAGKRKRSSSDANGSVSYPAVGTTIQVYWEDDRRWHTGVVQEKSGSEVQILYENDSNPEWLDLNVEAKWRLPTVRSKRIENANKRKRGSSTANHPSSRGASTATVPANVATKEDLAGLREELLAAVDDSKQVVLNTLQASTVAIENKLNRSDALHRVLIAVSDMQASMEGGIDGVQKLLDDVTLSVSALAKHVNMSRNEPQLESQIQEEEEAIEEAEKETNVEGDKEKDSLSDMEIEKPVEKVVEESEKSVVDVEKEKEKVTSPGMKSDGAQDDMDISDEAVKNVPEDEMKSNDMVEKPASPDNTENAKEVRSSDEVEKPASSDNTGNAKDVSEEEVESSDKVEKPASPDNTGTAKDLSEEERSSDEVEKPASPENAEDVREEEVKSTDKIIKPASPQNTENARDVSEEEEEGKSGDKVEKLASPENTENTKAGSEEDEDDEVKSGDKVIKAASPENAQSSKDGEEPKEINVEKGPGLVSELR